MNAEPKPEGLTDAEEDWITRRISTDEPTLNVAPLLHAVEDIVTAREAAARREALLEAEGKHRFILSQTWNDGWASGVADAACWQRGEDVQATSNPYGTEVGARITAALAEPERDEEGSR